MMIDTHLDPLLRDIDAFLAETEMAPTVFGRDALGDPGFVFGLRAGRDYRRSTSLRAYAQMKHYRSHGEFFRRPPRCSGRSPEAAA